MTHILDPKTGERVPLRDLREQSRRGDWIETYTGRKAWPLDLRPEDVDPVDVAHALSMQCRFNGHTRQFYSVAQHCVHLHDYAAWKEMDPRVRLTLLVHDAAEAYLGDVPLPLKRSIWVRSEAGGFYTWKEIEAQADRACVDALGGEFPFPPAVKELDRRILLDERAWLMSPGGKNHWSLLDGVAPLDLEVFPRWDAARACREWLDRLPRARIAAGLSAL